ncbi:hypothetical protein Cgig2_029933 [Carnegiea gigantea]|uniref:Uncharacterized protein n=1 Tax=Carnegiea gigantea TaxID=171969 RepID=A0A9Q1JPA0_9CARY|nr:hypothetical protein Cgig2_029933 [Carnegiea gigantea]
MGKRGGQKRESNAGVTSSSGLHTSLCLREAASGRKQSHNPKSLLKLKHLQNLAEWATKEASIPSLGAFFGCRFAEFGEALGIRADPSLFPCQSCETLLQPGFNCTVRIEKNQVKRRHRRGKAKAPTQNNVVYACNFCSHRNLKRGTPKGHMREICPKTNLPPKLKAGNPTAQSSDNGEKSNTEKAEAQEAFETPSPTTDNVIRSLTDSEATSAPKLLDSNRSKRKKAGSKGSTDQSLVGSGLADAKNDGVTNTSRKRRKSWSTLKEIARSEELERNQRLQKLPIPFRL